MMKSKKEGDMADQFKEVMAKSSMMDRMKELADSGQTDGEEYFRLVSKLSDVKLSDGRIIKNAIKYDNEVAKELRGIGLPLTDSGFFDDKQLKAMTKVMNEFKDNYKKTNLGNNMFDLSNKEETLKFCEIAPMIPQFRARKDFFGRRKDMVNEANVYRFREEMIRLLMEKNKTDIGYRHMPRNNIFLEVFLEYKDIIINGIHIIKVVVNEKNEQVFLSRDDKAIPPTFCKEEISVYYSGFANGVNFFDNFILDKEQMRKEEGKKKIARYACPMCSKPMTDLTKTEIMCESDECKEAGLSIVYDLSDSKVKRAFKTQYMKDIWKVEDTLRKFVCNFLDFITNREVRVRPLLTEEERRDRNVKRQKRGKSYLPPIKIIDVSGHIYKYINIIKSQFKGDIEQIKKQIWVDGHNIRFWNREHYTGLYGLINKCRTDEEKEAKLRKTIRKDSDGHPMPEDQQYEWDRANQVIKVWVLPFIKNKDGEVEDREIVKVVRQ